MFKLLKLMRKLEQRYADAMEKGAVLTAERILKKALKLSARIAQLTAAGKAATVMGGQK